MIALYLKGSTVCVCVSVACWCKMSICNLWRMPRFLQRNFNAKNGWVGLQLGCRSGTRERESAPPPSPNNRKVGAPSGGSSTHTHTNSELMFWSKRKRGSLFAPPPLYTHWDQAFLNKVCLFVLSSLYFFNFFILSEIGNCVRVSSNREIYNELGIDIQPWQKRRDIHINSEFEIKSQSEKENKRDYWLDGTNTKYKHTIYRFGQVCSHFTPPRVRI